MCEFFHYTCEHQGPKIRESELVLPGAGVDIFHDGDWHRQGAVAWFTDQPIANRAALGLTSATLTCDRTAWRFRVEDTQTLVHWPKFRRTLSPAGLAWALLLEEAEGVKPMHWWVSTSPVLVEVPGLRRGDR